MAADLLNLPSPPSKWWPGCDDKSGWDVPVGGMLTPDEDEDDEEDLGGRQVLRPSDLSAISNSCRGLMSV